MKKGAPFEPYQGSDPYIFISYAHKDSEKVFEVISRLHRLRYRIWYDEGIEIGENWPQVVAERLLFSDTVLVFVSGNAMHSQNCLREIHYAVSNRKKLVVVQLDDGELPADIQMQLSVAEYVRRDTAENTVQTLCTVLEEALLGDGVTGYGRTGLRKKGGKNGWILTSLVLLLLAGGLTAYILFGKGGSIPGGVSVRGIRQETLSSADGSEISVTTFKDALSMEILLNSLEGEYVHLAGSSVVSDASAVSWSDGTWSIAGTPVERGTVGKLDYFANKGIRQLSLICEDLHDLSGIEALRELRYLDLSDNPLTDLSGLKALSQLETLRITHMPAELDLTPLTQLPALKTVYISFDMASAAEPLVNAGILTVLVR